MPRTFLVWLGITGCGGAEFEPELCGDNVDNDGNGLSDCEDEACASTACPELCGDGFDNDADTRIDCADLGCLGSGCAEVCEDDLDNDGNGAADCGDPVCFSSACAEVCQGDLDEDADGLTDCGDPDCHGPTCQETCLPGLDVDGDGLVGCADSDCWGASCLEACDDLRDNDGDTVVDCFDDACWCTEACPCDVDADGFVDTDMGGNDCDDALADVNPAAIEICDWADNDCDDLVDDADPDAVLTDGIGVWVDADGDEFGDPSRPGFACALVPGVADNGDDCDDLDAEVFPLSLEVCDGADNDCNNLIDDEDPGLSFASLFVWYGDDDRDGFGASEQLLKCADPGADWTSVPGDCNDADIKVRNPTDWWADLDADGYGAGVIVVTDSCVEPAPGLVRVDVGTDCDDADDGRHPFAPDLCSDGIDQDCDGVVDDCVCDVLRVARPPGQFNVGATLWPDLLARQADFGVCAIELVNLPGGLDLRTLAEQDVRVLLLDAPGAQVPAAVDLDVIEEFLAVPGRGLVVLHEIFAVWNGAFTLAPRLGVNPEVVGTSADMLSALQVTLVLDHPVVAGIPVIFIPANGYNNAQQIDALWSDALVEGGVVVSYNSPAADSATVVFDDGRVRGVWMTWNGVAEATEDGQRLDYNALVWAGGFVP